MKDVASLRFSKAQIAFMRVFSLELKDTVDREKACNNLENNGIELVRECKELHDFSIAESFLLSEREREEYFRIALGGFSLHFPRFHAQPSTHSVLEVDPFLAVYPESDIGIILFNIKLKDFTVDEIVFLEQCFEGFPLQVSHDPPEFINSVPNPCPIIEIIENYVGCVVKALGRKDRSLSDYKSRCIEINGVKNMALTNAHDLFDDFPREIFGLVTMDEGWKFVPQEVAQERLNNLWTTRNFICATAYHSSTIAINLSESTTSNKYVESQRHLRTGFGMELEEYLQFSPTIAGLNHGPLLMLEQSSVQFYKIEEVMRKTERLDLKNIKTLLYYRSILSRVLNALARIKIQEIGTLRQVITHAMGLPKLYEILEKKLEDIERALTIRYDQRMNNMMIVLTVLGVLIAMAGLYISNPQSFADLISKLF